MSVAHEPKPRREIRPRKRAGSGDVTVADLLRSLGGVPADRVRLRPAPGTATERDLIGVRDHEGRICELIEGTLVEKTMGALESAIAAEIILAIGTFLKHRRLGVVLGADGALRLFPSLVRVPDVSFISWGRLPGGKLPSEPIPSLVPDLVVEVLSKGNTKTELKRKLGEYFAAGLTVVWLVDPRTKTVRVHESAKDSTLLAEDQVIEGGSGPAWIQGAGERAIQPFRADLSLNLGIVVVRGR